MKQFMDEVLGALFFSACIIIPVALYWFGIIG